jgi:hypothetical protein
MKKILKSKVNLIIILNFIYKSLFFSLLITSLAIFSSPKKGNVSATVKMERVNFNMINP